MSKKVHTFAFLALLLSGGLRAEDSALYWMIDDNNKIEFSYAVVHAIDESGAVSSFTKDWRYDEDTGEFSSGMTMESLTDLGSQNWSSYSFYIELVQWDGQTGKTVGISQTSSYADLVTNHHIGATGMEIPDLVVFWAPTVSVPEPTSGLLALLGGALLLLRRRDNVA